MRAYIIRRLLQALPVLFLGSVAVFVFVRLLPGDPATVLSGKMATPEQVRALRHNLGFDKPLIVQYGIWISHALSGNLGYSYTSGHSVSGLLVNRLPATAQLAVMSLIVSLVFALPLGVIGAIRPRSILGRLANGYRTAGLAIPTFWLGILLILAFAVNWRLLPSVSNFKPLWSDPVGAVRYSALPVLAIGFHVGALTARYVSAALGDVMGMDFIRTVRAKGARESRVLVRHGLRNALLPVVTVVGLQLGALLGGAIVIEVVFNYPGLGRLIYTAVSKRDYVVVQGGVLFVILIFIVINLIVDLLYAVLDPRIRMR